MQYALYTSICYKYYRLNIMKHNIVQLLFIEIQRGKTD